MTKREQRMRSNYASRVKRAEQAHKVTSYRRAVSAVSTDLHSIDTDIVAKAKQHKSYIRESMCLADTIHNGRENEHA